MRYHYYGAGQQDITAKTSEYKGIWTPDDLYQALSGVWCKETCSPGARAGWSEKNRTSGQCTITAFLAQDIFGGKVYGILRPGGNYHCYNVVDGKCFDLTSEQFGKEALCYEGNPEQLREVQFADEGKRQRYELLRKRLREQQETI